MIHNAYLHEHHPFTPCLLPLLCGLAAMHEGVDIAVTVRFRENREGVVWVEHQGGGGVLCKHRW